MPWRVCTHSPHITHRAPVLRCARQVQQRHEVGSCSAKARAVWNAVVTVLCVANADDGEARRSTSTCQQSNRHQPLLHDDLQIAVDGGGDLCSRQRAVFDAGPARLEQTVDVHLADPLPELARCQRHVGVRGAVVGVKQAAAAEQRPAVRRLNVLNMGARKA